MANRRGKRLTPPVYRERVCKSCGAAYKPVSGHQKFCASCGGARAVNKRSVFAHYGTVCACCGSTENLAIDHIYGAGRAHRETVGEASHDFYRWLVKNDFPSGFQTLCAPCNNSKRDGERCRLLHVPTCPTCHRPFEEETAVDSRGNRIWSAGRQSA